MFHGKRHPADLGGPEITRFLTALATRDRVSASTQNQALSALLFLYRDVLGKELGAFRRSSEPDTGTPSVVISREEVVAVMAEVAGTMWIIVALLYGAG